MPTDPVIQGILKARQAKARSKEKDKERRKAKKNAHRKIYGHLKPICQRYGLYIRYNYADSFRIYINKSDNKELMSVYIGELSTNTYYIPPLPASPFLASASAKAG